MMEKEFLTEQQDREFAWIKLKETTIKEKEHYKYSKKSILKNNLQDLLTFEAAISHAEYRGKDLYLYIDCLCDFGTPIVKAGEMYWNCLLVIHGAKLAPKTTEDYSCTVSQNRLDELQQMLEYRSLYMSFREFMVDGCDDVTIRCENGRMIIVGYGWRAKHASLWANFEFDFHSISCYFDEIYDYMNGEPLD